MAVLWKAREADVKIASTLSTVATATQLYDQVAAQSNDVNYEDIARNLKLKLPESGTDLVQLLGEDSGGNQNEILDPKRKSKAELTMTLLVGNKDTTQWFVQAETSAPSGFTRYNYGNADPTNKLAVAIRFDDGGSPGDRVNYLMNEALMVKAGEIEIDAEGYAIQEVMFECTASDFYEEMDIGN
jgi:hypothetical protein